VDVAWSLIKHQRAGFIAHLKAGKFFLESIINLLYFYVKRRCFGCDFLRNQADASAGPQRNDAYNMCIFTIWCAALGLLIYIAHLELKVD